MAKVKFKNKKSQKLTKNKLHGTVSFSKTKHGIIAKKWPVKKSRNQKKKFYKKQKEKIGIKPPKKQGSNDLATRSLFLLNEKKREKTNKYKIIDLFAGCGGLSNGFEKADFEAMLGIDNWEDSLYTYKQNHKHSEIIYGDICKISYEDIMKKTDGAKPAVIIGGPPCQGFSLAGKRDKNDGRNNLVYEFIRIVSELKPEFFVMENVLGMLSMKNGNGEKVIDKITKKFADIGYIVKYSPLCAHNYGVPQIRRRVFIVGNRLGIDFSFPEPTHDGKIKPFVTVGDAISDLPLLDNDLGREICDYNTTPQSEYQQEMRKGSDKLYNHTKSNHSVQTSNVISLVPEGGNWKDLPIKFQNIRSYSNTWKRLDSKKPSVTIDTGHRHHFHYKANRVPTVRESARIQSFSDDFIFLGSRTSQFKQVGNAVPPLLAMTIARRIKYYLDNYYEN